MEYVHELNDEFTENLRQMLLISSDNETIKFAIEILNHVNISDKQTKFNVLSLVLDTNCGLGIEFGDNNSKSPNYRLNSAEKWDMFEKTPYYLDDFTRSGFSFYSINLLIKSSSII